MIDLHCHVLAGIDDGPQTVEGSLTLARAAHAAGLRTLVATPHVSARYRNDEATIARLVAELNEQLRAENIALNVLPGAEIAITYVPELDPAALLGLGLGGGPWLLVEPPFTAVAPGLENLIYTLCGRGHRVLLAHPERCPALQRDRTIVPALAAQGVLMSVTAGSLIGRFGSEVKRYALELASAELIHNVTSDAHNTDRRPPGIADAIEQAGLAPLTAWLTEEVPHAILAGADIPPRPSDAALPIADGHSAHRRRPWKLRR